MNTNEYSIELEREGNRLCATGTRLKEIAREIRPDSITPAYPIYPQFGHAEMWREADRDMPDTTRFGMKPVSALVDLGIFNMPLWWREQYAMGPDRMSSTPGALATELANVVDRRAPADFGGLTMINFENIPLDLSHPDFQVFAQGRDPDVYHEKAVELFIELTDAARQVRPNSSVGWYGMVPHFSPKEPAKMNAAIDCIRRSEWFWRDERGPNIFAPSAYIMPPKGERNPMGVGVMAGDRLDANIAVWRNVFTEAVAVRTTPLSFMPYFCQFYLGSSDLTYLMTQEEFDPYFTQLDEAKKHGLILYCAPGRAEGDASIDDIERSLELLLPF